MVGYTEVGFSQLLDAPPDAEFEKVSDGCAVIRGLTATVIARAASTGLPQCPMATTSGGDTPASPFVAQRTSDPGLMCRLHPLVENAAAGQFAKIHHPRNGGPPLRSSREVALTVRDERRESPC
jgi:hypothetical protein